MTPRRERLVQLARTLQEKLCSSLRRFPETLLFCTATVIVLLILRHGEFGPGGETGQALTRLAAVLALGVPLTLCLRIFFERSPQRNALPRVLAYAAAAAGLILYYLFLLPDFGFSMVTMWRYALSTLALYLAFTFIPHFSRRPHYELYVIKLFISFLITYLFASVLFGGLAAILASINYLFQAKIPDSLYLDIWLVVGAILAPAFFLADIPGSDEEPDPDSYPRVIRTLLCYIVMPLLLAYAVILYAYFLKVLAIREWPEIMVSHLVLWYAIFSALVLFGIHPLRGVSGWVRSFTSFFPKLLLPLLALMFAAMGVRVSAYGITENRYFVLAAGLWVTAAMLYLIISRKPRHVFLPASLALVAILSVYGPWSSFSVSAFSQNRRFEKIAAAHSLLRDGKIAAPAAALPREAREELSSIILYFDRYHGLERLRALPEGFRTDQTEALLGFPLHEYPYPGDREIYFYRSLDEREAFADISGFHYFLDFTKGGQHYRAGDLEVTYSPVDHGLEITLHGEPVYSRDLAGIAAGLHRDDAATEGREWFSRDEMSFMDSSGELKLLYLFRSIGGWERGDREGPRIEFLEFYLFIAPNGGGGR